MPWILYLLAVGCFAVMCITKSFALGVFCMLLALVFIVIATMLLLSAKVENGSRNFNVLSPEELRALRDQADARRQNAIQAGSNRSADPIPPAPGTEQAADTKPAPPASA
jgi:hypothetical protein